MYTGYSDYDLTRVYKSSMNKSYISYNHTYYDGYRVISEQTSPYPLKDQLYGTDAIQNRPMCPSSDSQYIFIDTLYRIG